MVMNASGVDMRAPDPADGGPEEAWLLTPLQVARRLNVSRSRVYELLAQDLESVTIGRSRRIRTSDLRRWLEERGKG